MAQEAAAGEAAAGEAEAAAESTEDLSTTPDTEENKDRNLQLILDIPLRVTVELGRTKMPVNELLNLGQGSVIELNKL
ncbi:MAG: flagellar motor switch protein FliN, partial [Bdellovibrio sp. CG10_big_fil_rev_8_21_14_0_10_47_8]